MKKNHSILIILRKDKKGLDGKYPLNVQVTINSKVMKLSTKCRVYANEWDAKNRLCIGKGNGDINTFLKNIVAKLEAFCMNKLVNSQPLYLDAVRDYYNGVSIKCFYTVFDRVFEIKTKKLKPPTIYKYNLLRKYLKEFKKQIDVSEVNLLFVEKFEDFLLLKGVGKFGISNHHKNLDAIINLAIKHKLMDDNPYVNKEYKEISEKINFLKPNELLSFTKIEVEKNSGLELTKDRFLFACYTALRFSDLNNLKVGDIDIKNKILRITQIKTGGYVEVPLNLRAKILFIKYSKGKDEDEVLFPSVVNQNDNERLKILAGKIGLNFNLTFHVSRHTFGTMMVNHFRTPITIVSKMMGHTDISMTARYANVDIGMAKEAMNGYKI